MKKNIWVVIGLIMVLSLPSFGADCKVCKSAEKSACCAECSTGKSVSNEMDVWWGNRGRAFGNYMKFAKSDVVMPEKPAVTKFDTIYFELDKARLTEEGTRIAEQVLNYMKLHPEVSVRIEGHCCDLHTENYNQALGQRRADAVKKYLTERGIESSRIETVSFGESQRVTTDVKKRHLNRRAEVYAVVSFTTKP